MTTYIYGLIDPETDEMRYVGKSNNPKVRYQCHLADKNTNPHKTAWIRRLSERGLKPKLVIIEETQKDICWQSAMGGITESWVGIRQRGGNPEIEFSVGKQYLKVRDTARSLLTLYGT